MSKGKMEVQKICTINKVEEKCFEMDCDCIDSNWRGVYCQCLSPCNKKVSFEYQKHTKLMKSVENQINMKI